MSAKELVSDYFIVHEIIEEHDGCIAVDSKIDEGTTFLIVLPLRKT